MRIWAANRLIDIGLWTYRVGLKYGAPRPTKEERALHARAKQIADWVDEQVPQPHERWMNFETGKYRDVPEDFDSRFQSVIENE